jgi:hypothetical protein
MLACATRRVVPAAFAPTRRGAENGCTRTVVRSVTRLGLARSLRSSFSRAGTATRCIQTLVAWSSKAVPCPLPAARSRSLLHRAGRSARAATAAPRRCFVSASVLHRSERFRRGCRAGWRSAIPSTPRSSSTSSAGLVATSSEQRWPAEPRGHDHAHPSPRRRTADVEIERRRSHPACAARLARAAPAGAGTRIACHAAAVALRSSWRDALKRELFSDAAGREPVTLTCLRLAPV